MTTTNESKLNDQIVFRGRNLELQTIILECKEEPAFKDRSHSELLALFRQLLAYQSELDKSLQKCDFSQNNADLKDWLETAKEYILTVPDQIGFSTLYIQSLTCYVKSVDVATLRLSKGTEEYDMRTSNFERMDGIKIFMEDVSILKERGDEFFENLEMALVELSTSLPKDVVMNIIPPRGLEGLARSFGSFEGWFSFLDRAKSLGLNIAVLGQIEKPQIALQLTLSLFSGSFNLYQVLGMMKSSNPKTAKAGRTNFFNNYSDNYTLSSYLLEALMSEK